VLTQQRSGFQHGTALGARELIVELPHVESEGHAAPEELRTLVAVELDPAVNEIAVLVEIRPIDKRLPANVARQFLFGWPCAVVRRFCLRTVEYPMAN